ncbi:MAG: class I lanthipeptide [Acidobacteria bacterium]|jgi:hypothetical protein|nr:class I lanthipeptide [Acidobacteriota bacterium]
MKSKKIEKKLIFKKETISHLSYDEVDKIRGGTFGGTHDSCPKTVCCEPI